MTGVDRMSAAEQPAFILTLLLDLAAGFARTRWEETRQRCSLFPTVKWTRERCSRVRISWLLSSRVAFHEFTRLQSLIFLGLFGGSLLFLPRWHQWPQRYRWNPPASLCQGCLRLSEVDDSLNCLQKHSSCKIKASTSWLDKTSGSLLCYKASKALVIYFEVCTKIWGLGENLTHLCVFFVWSAILALTKKTNRCSTGQINSWQEKENTSQGSEIYSKYLKGLSVRRKVCFLCGIITECM